MPNDDNDDEDYDRRPGAVLQQLSGMAEYRNVSVRHPATVLRQLQKIDRNQFGGPEVVKRMWDANLKILRIGDTTVETIDRNIKTTAVKTVLQSSKEKRDATRATIKLLKTKLAEWDTNRDHYMPRGGSSPLDVPWQTPVLAGGLRAVADITEINALFIDLMRRLQQEDRS